MVKFNHYNESFPITDGVLKWFDIDEEYCFSTVYETGFFLTMHPEENKEAMMQVKGHTFVGCENGKTYVAEAKEAKLGETGAYVDGVEEEAKIEEEPVEEDIPDVTDDDPVFSNNHPKNLKYVHEIIVHKEYENSLKDFKDLHNPEILTKMFDKT